MHKDHTEAEVNRLRALQAQRRTHDFYLGRGPLAEFLGSVRVNVDVGVLSDQLLAPYRLWREGNAKQPYTDEVWKRRVDNLLDSTHEMDPHAVSISWPHPYKNSLESDYSWWFEKGGLYLYNQGALVEIRYPNGGIKSKLRFPDFTPVPAS
jgi:hypothetical protein